MPAFAWMFQDSAGLRDSFLRINRFSAYCFPVTELQPSLPGSAVWVRMRSAYTTAVRFAVTFITEASPNKYLPTRNNYKIQQPYKEVDLTYLPSSEDPFSSGDIENYNAMWTLIIFAVTSRWFLIASTCQSEILQWTDDENDACRGWTDQSSRDWKHLPCSVFTI